MKTVGSVVLCLSVVALSAIALYPQIPSSQPGIHIIDLMSAAEFQRSGLSKLTPPELSALDGWLNNYLGRIVAHLSKSTSAAPTGNAIETHIDGEFHGWDGETIFKLANGQIWQQAEYDYDYEYAYQPDVTIYKTDSGYKMKVEDVEDTITVKRIK